MHHISQQLLDNRNMFHMVKQKILQGKFRHSALDKVLRNFFLHPFHSMHFRFLRQISVAKKKDFDIPKHYVCMKFHCNEGFQAQL